MLVVCVNNAVFDCVHIIIHVSSTSKVQCEDIREDESVEVEVITIWVTRKQKF